MAGSVMLWIFNRDYSYNGALLLQRGRNMVKTFPKEKKVSDSKYLDWIKQQPCAIRTRHGQHIVDNPMLIWTQVIDPHHVRGNRHNDRMAIPMCRFHHSRIHALSSEKKEQFLKQFENKFDILVKQYNEKYESEVKDEA